MAKSGWYTSIKNYGTDSGGNHRNGSGVERGGMVDGHLCLSFSRDIVHADFHCRIAGSEDEIKQIENERQTAAVEAEEI